MTSVSCGKRRDWTQKCWSSVDYSTVKLFVKSVLRALLSSDVFWVNIKDVYLLSWVVFVCVYLCVLRAPDTRGAWSETGGGNWKKCWAREWVNWKEVCLRYSSAEMTQFKYRSHHSQMMTMVLIYHNWRGDQALIWDRLLIETSCLFRLLLDCKYTLSYFSKNLLSL